MTLFALVVMTAMAAASAIAADIVKCTDAAGKVIYQNTPCATKAVTKKVDVGNAAPSADAEAARARLAKESAEFNARYDARERAKLDAQQLPAQFQEPGAIEPAAKEPQYIPYAVNTCGGPGQPKCKVEVEIKPTRPPPPPPSVPSRKPVS